MSEWFTTDRIDRDTFIISEYRHWEETHAYLLNGKGKKPDYRYGARNRKYL